MKKIFILLAVSLTPAILLAHTQLRDASTLTRGTLPNGRLQFGTQGSPVQTGFGVIFSSMMQGGTLAGGSPCSVVIGTVGAYNVDYVVTNQTDFNNVLAAVNAFGIMFNSTVSATICAKDGVYPLSAARIPQGLTLKALASSAVIVDAGGTGTQLITIGGAVKGMKFDLSGLAFTSNKITLSSQAVFDDNVMLGMANQGTGGVTLYIKGTGIRATRIKYIDQPSVAGNSKYGDAGGLVVDRSSNVTIQIDAWNGIVGAGDPSNIGIIGSTGVHIVNSDLDLGGGNGIVIQDGSLNCSIEDTRIRTLNAGTQGIIVIGHDTGNTQSISSTTILRGVDITAPAGDTGVAILIGGASATTANGVMLDNVTIRGMAAVGTFIKVNATAQKTVITDVKVLGSGIFLSDSGLGTSQQGNYKNGISQDVGTTPVGGSGTSPQIYQLVVGTAGATNVDAYVTNLQQFNLALASLAACGLTTSATGYGSIIFRPGVYQIFGATKPAGVDLIAFQGSSVVWQAINGTNTLINIYGDGFTRMDGFKFDLGGTGIASSLISLKNGGRLTNFQIYNATGLAKSPTTSTYQYCLLCVEKSSNVVIQGEMRDYICPTGAGNYGDNAPFKIKSSSNVDVRVNMSPAIVEAAAAVGIYVTKSDFVNIHDSMFSNIGGDWMQFDSGNSNCFYERNKHIITRTAGDTGLIVFAGQTDGAVQISTGTMSIAYNDFEIRTTDAGNIIASNGNGGAVLNCGLAVRHNTLHVTTTGVGVSQYKFGTLGTPTKGGVFQGNITRGITAFLADSGANNLSASQGNTLYGVEQ